jgi:hypothetical protein
MSDGLYSSHSEQEEMSIPSHTVYDALRVAREYSHGFDPI